MLPPFPHAGVWKYAQAALYTLSTFVASSVVIYGFGQPASQHAQGRLVFILRNLGILGGVLLLLGVGTASSRAHAGLLLLSRVFLAGHGLAVAVSYSLGPTTYFQHFSPRWSEPHTLLCSCFATTSPFELLYLSGNLLGVGAELQRSAGRAFLLLLYLSGAASVSLLAAQWRHSATGAGGALACGAYHALRSPSARHSVFGLEMSAKAALAVQVAVASWPAFNGAVGRPAVLIALNCVPALLGAALFLGSQH